MKFIVIILAMTILMSLIVSATITRYKVSDTIVRYDNSDNGIYSRAYWAVEETINCQETSVLCTSTDINTNCGYFGGKIKIVGYTPDGGGQIPTSISVTLNGPDSCTLDSGIYVVSTPISLGSEVILNPSITLTFGTDCSTLSSSALNAIISWASNPTSTNKNAALTAISDWATSC